MAARAAQEPAIRALAVLALLTTVALALWAWWPGDVPPDPPPPVRPSVAWDSGPAVAAADAGTPAADLTFNPGWIGAACQHDADCAFEGGFCLLAEEGFPRGYCSQRCSKFCPDREGDLFSQTFCAEDHAAAGQGLCLARCNLHLTRSGCRPGYVCTTVIRLREATNRLVCLPDLGTPAPPSACTQQLDRQGLLYAQPDLADALARAARAGDPMPDQGTCQVDVPVLLASPIHSVDFREVGQRHAEHLLVACRFALVVEKLAALVAAEGVVEVQHMGTFNCRSVAGTRSLSGHGHGLAIDIAGFERAEGSPVEILRDWNGADPEKRRFLRELTGKLRDSGLFSQVLTPESNAAHANHLHLEIARGP